VSKFVTPLRVEKIDGNKWRLLQPLVYRSDVAKTVFYVPAGEDTDFASVPRVPLAFLLAGDSAHAAAVVHDHLYKTHEVDRAMADRVFEEAALVCGEPTWRAALMWAGVRVGGWHAWDK
jgi:hypothetical protein